MKDKKKISQDWEKSQARLLDLIFEHSLDSIVLLDKDYNFIKVSETYARSTQRDAFEFPGKNHFDLYPSNFKDELEEYRRDKKIYKRNKRPFVYPDHPEWGVTYWDLGMVPILDKAGEIEFFLLTLKDVTERVRAENALLESQNRLALAARAGGVGIWDWDFETDKLIWDDKMLHLYGIEEEEFPGTYRSWLGYIHEEDCSLVHESIQESILHKKSLDIEFRIVRPGEEVVYIKAFADIIIDEQGRPERMVGTNWDITQRKKTEESMKMAASIYESSAEAIMVTDHENKIIQVNPAFTEITGYTLSEVAGKDPSILQSGLHDREFYDKMWESIEKKGAWKGEIIDRRKDGEIYTKWSNIRAFRRPDGEIYRYIAQFSDITERKKKDELIWQQANYDILTGLPNRRLFYDRLKQELIRAKRAQTLLALLFIDLDRFKEINDTLGHAKGDLLLIEAGKRIQLCIRGGDIIARLGGDEFMAALSGYRDRAQVDYIAQRIIDELSKPFYFEGDVNGYYLSASIGITLYPEDTTSVDDLFKHADQAMYQAKAQGRQRFNYFTKAMQLEASKKLQLAQELRRAVKNQELYVYYQPIVELSTNKIIKAEALLRWVSPQKGMISPGEFIELAEESGLIHEIGEWVFGQVIYDIKRWREMYGRIISVSVNRSPVQFENSPFEIAWPQKLSNFGLPGDSIIVEITEGLLLKQSAKTSEQLLEYRKSGIGVSIDDFGTGFSSLSYLRKFDIDYLKIDRSFIKNMTEDKSDEALTEAIIVMAHKLGIKTIAEGVETEAQRNLLSSFGCDHAQGFLYSPAVPSERFEKMLAG